MLQSEQISVGKQLFEYIENKTSFCFDTLYRQPIKEYFDRAQADVERDVFFREDLLCVGLSSLLPEPGTYFTENLAGVPLLLTRDNNGIVHGFLNVCRHRGSRVVEGCGRARSLACPYHAWTYDLGGRLVGRPLDEFFNGAPRDEHGLQELCTYEHNGMLWVCPTPGVTIDIQQKLGGLATELEAYKLDSFHHYGTYTMQRDMNWKLMVDTFLESYHFCVLHKDTICSIFYDNLATFDSWGPNFRLVSARRTIHELKQQSETDWNLLPHIVGIYVLFPNTVLIWQLDHIELWHIYPYGDTPEKAILRLDLYTPEAAVTDKAKEHWDKNLELVVKVVQEEDFPLGESIQAGFHSAAQDHIIFGANEPGLTFYHQAITEATAHRDA